MSKKLIKKKRGEDLSEPDAMDPSSENGRTFFNYFSDESGMLGYIRGNWKGLGLQGDPGLGGDVEMSVKLTIGKKGIDGSLRLFYRQKTFLQRLIGYFVEADSNKNGAFDYRKGLQIHMAKEDSMRDIGPDLVRISDSQWNITLQALANNRMHIVIYSNNPPCMIFAGTVLK